MDRKLSVTFKSDDGTFDNTVYFKFSPELYLKGECKSTVVNATFFVAEEEVGIISMDINDFNNFCLNLFSQHKEIMANNGPIG